MQKRTVCKKKAVMAAATGGLLFVLGIFALSGEICIGQACQSVTIDGEFAGYTSGKADVKRLIHAVRRELAGETDEKLCMDFEWNADTVRKPFVKLLQETELRERVKQILERKVISSGQKVYTVAIGSYRGNFRSL